ncbi:MAG: hypothetical protein GQ527_00870, partial [Bacteroidales bacterium]|nr:hypothetical protein [Bacteroidales bacterium]
MKLMKLLFVAIFVGLLVNVSSAQDLEEVLSSHFEAVNQEAVTRLDGMYMTGKSGRMGQEFSFEIWQQRPGKFRME